MPLRHLIMKMYCYKLVCLCCLIIAVGSSGRLMRRRRGSCEYGTYEHEGKSCCMCPSGYSVSVQCTENTDTKCELCTSGSFMNHPNSADQCQPCKTCMANANMEMEKKCTQYSDTVCTCTENHYCDKGDLCRTCYPCDKCEEHGVKAPCTATNNTVCKDVKGTTGNIVAGILVPFLIIIGIALLVYFLWRKKKLRLKQTNRENPQVEKPLLKDVDLNTYLQDIASILDLKKMKNVARHTGMHQAEIDQHEQNHPQDVKEQTYRLLQGWCETQGLYTAYPTLIKTLRELKHNKTADEIIQIVEKGQDTAYTVTVK